MVAKRGLLIFGFSAEVEEYKRADKGNHITRQMKSVTYDGDRVCKSTSDNFNSYECGSYEDDYSQAIVVI